MAIFKFPQKKIVLDCFTSAPQVIDSAPIVPAIKIIPDWWRNLPSEVIEEGRFSPTPTMKNCVGMIDYYKKSIAIPMWSDLSIKISENKVYYWHFADGESSAGTHNLLVQANGFLNDYAHIKLESPWLFKTKEDINWVWSFPSYNFPKSHELLAPPAIISYKHQHTTNMNLLIHDDKPRTIFIPHGQPMMLISPMSDRKVEIVRHLVTQEEYRRLDYKATNLAFIKKHQKGINSRDKFSDCPFHNHTKGN